MKEKITLMGKKRGMTRLFDENGKAIPCTVIEIEPNVVTQIKSADSDGYIAVQLAFEKITAKDPRRAKARVKKPQLGLFEKSEIEPRKHLIETRVESAEELALGQEIGVEIFEDIKYIDVAGSSKGKGYQGVMKKYNFSGGPAAHGSGFHRHAGSTGMRSTPGRCFAGSPRPSRMGGKRVSVQSLEIVRIYKDKGLLLVKGSIPGHTKGLVYISQAIKKQAK
jgi:large subunit ribosomal protein L3